MQVKSILFQGIYCLFPYKVIVTAEGIHQTFSYIYIYIYFFLIHIYIYNRLPGAPGVILRAFGLY